MRRRQIRIETAFVRGYPWGTVIWRATWRVAAVLWLSWLIWQLWTA